jgi:hypothetical protein
MRRILFATALAAIMLPLGVHAEDAKKADPPALFRKGASTLGFALGFGVNHYGWMTGFSATHSPAFNVIYDRGVAEVGPGTIGVGGILGYKTTAFSPGNTRFNTVVIGVRGTYHLNIIKKPNNKFDPYAGLVLGIRSYSYGGDWGGWRPGGGSELFTGVFAGCRYKFSSKFGAFAELGYDISVFRLGVNVDL